jgi:hypothetical protein
MVADGRSASIVGVGKQTESEKTNLEFTVTSPGKLGVAEKSQPTPSGEDWRLFNPSIGDDGSTYAMIRGLAKLPREEAVARLSVFSQENRGHTLHALKARVATSLIRDLLNMGWDVHATPHHVYVRPPRPLDPVQRKALTRQQLLFGRDDQLREDSNRRFLYGVERPSKYSSCKPMTELIADGRRLAEQLRPIAAVPRPLRAAMLERVCQPYLQLVSEERDEFTNQRLIDIWRYFRHSWSTRYRSTPGRNLFYLVRDGAQPNHPVMGIAALGNTVMQLTPRDTELGWTLGGLLDVCARGEVTEAELLRAFRSRLEEDFEQIYRDDLPVDRRIDHCVDDETLSRLAVIEQDASRDREEALKGDDDTVARKYEDLTPERLLQLTRIPLYRAKRARAAREILRAYRTIATWHSSLSDLAATDHGSWALNTVLKQLKKRYSATSMMELTVCGAVAPYSHLLGGKLVCLLMASPRVVNDYTERYGGMVSVIASQMAGRPISKEPHLAFLGTTSLYTDHSSQYNRVKLPARTVAGQQATIEYRQIGRTEGFGSPNLSVETEQGLAEIAEAASGFRNVNFVFGEGQSPKLRLLREGFAGLGLNQTNLLQHGSPRIIYGVQLVSNLTRVLLGVDDQPAYAIDPTSADAEREIASHWVNRWLASRLEHAPALDAVASSSPLTERVSRLIPERPFEAGAQRSVLPRRMTGVGNDMQSDMQEDERLQFIRLLYRNESGISDHVSPARLKELNIKTNLDNVVRKAVRNGASVVVTGNAGDGKTHAISLMRKELKDAEVITDASEMTSLDIVTQWQQAREAGKPFCIAINEGPLVDLVRAHRKTHPWLEEIRSQLLRLVRYRPLEADQANDAENWKSQIGETVILDLSHRRVLSHELTASIVDKLTDDQWYQGCMACPARPNCAVTYNRGMLRSPGPRERMIRLLTTVGKTGAKVTFREALAFVSYTLFAGKTCAELKELGTSEEARYYWNAFEGEGTIFDLLSRGIDPMKQTNPQIDEQLWRGIFEPEAFVGNDLAPALQRNLDEVGEKEQRNMSDAFTALKRRWYFEHRDGQLLDFSEANSLFKDLQDTSSPMAIRLSKLITLINHWWNRGGEAKGDALRLWTKLSYHPRSRSQAMVSGLMVNRNRLRLYKPELSAVLRNAFGEQPVGHLLLASVDGPRFGLVVDPDLLGGLLHGSIADGQSEISRRLGQFNDTLNKHGDKSSDVRTIDVVDPQSELRTTVVVDLVNKRYDSAN